MSVQFKQVETRRLYQQIADQIRELIERGGFDIGDRLPPERELAQQLGVSPPSLREALIALDVEGTVEIRSGSGVYVNSPPERSTRATAALGESPTELMQARAALEGTVVALACARVTPAALAQLRACVDGMRQEIGRRRTPLRRVAHGIGGRGRAIGTARAPRKDTNHGRVRRYLLRGCPQRR